MDREQELAAWRTASVGASYDSYVLGGRPWALPLDDAAQVAVARPDLMEARPASWEQACQAARTHPTTLCLGGPHALLMFSAICVAAGSRWSLRNLPLWRCSALRMQATVR